MPYRSPSVPAVTSRDRVWPKAGVAAISQLPEPAAESEMVRTWPESIRAGESVNYVSGIICKPCVRNGPRIQWHDGRDSNPRPSGSKPERTRRKFR